MSGVERAGYLDSMAAASITENIVKEKKLQREYFRKQEAAGRVVAKPPPPKTMGRSALETMGIPAHVQEIYGNAEQSIALTTSKNMMSSNPGYIVRDGARMASATHKDYVYDQEEVDYMKGQGFLEKTHNRRRDEFVMFVEAHAKQHNLMKGSKAA